MRTPRILAESFCVAAFLLAAVGCRTTAVPLCNVTRGGQQWVWPYFLDGKPAVLAFWNTNEMQCLRDVPALKTLDAREGSVQLVTVVTGRDRMEIEKWLRREQIRYDVLLDLDEKLAEELDVYYYPTFIYLDVQGKEVDRVTDVRTVHNWFDRPRWLERSGAIAATSNREGY